jgi:hypothetical protein
VTRRWLAYLWAAPTTCLGLAVALVVVLGRGSVVRVDGVLEVDGAPLGLLLGRLAPVRGGVAAITLGHVVLGRDRACLDRTRAHERVHVHQCEQWGPFFIPAYLVASAWAVVRGGHAYRDNWFERQARRETEFPETSSRTTITSRYHESRGPSLPRG